MEYRHTRFQGAIVDGSRLLLIQHHAIRSNHRYWVLPGGGIEPDESEAGCVIREMREETGLTVRPERLIATHVNPPNHGIYRLQKTLLCRPVGGTLAPGDEPEVDFYDITDTAWLDLAEPNTWSELLTGDEWIIPVLWDIRLALGFGDDVPPEIALPERVPVLGACHSTASRIAAPGDSGADQTAAFGDGGSDRAAIDRSEAFVRPAAHADQAGWLELVTRVTEAARKAGLDEWTYTQPGQEHFEHDLAAGTLAVAAHDGRVVGTITASEEHRIAYRSVGWQAGGPALVIHRLAVDPDYRGKGVGRALLRTAEEHAVRQRYRACRLAMRPSNNEVVRFFERAGYRGCARVRRASNAWICYERRVGLDGE